MESLNRNAIELVDEAIDFAGELNVAVRELATGSMVLDFGVEADGGIEAGLLLTEIQTAGIATVQTRMDTVGDATLPHVEVSTDHPALSLLCAQKAGWELSIEGFDGLGSGPARALVGEETEFERVGYYDEFDLTVLAIESDQLPDEAVVEAVADRAGVEDSGVFLPTYPTSSAVGSVTAAARAAELATFRLSELGYDPTDILSAAGSAPMAPVAGDEATAMGRTNDAVAYGGRAYLRVREDFDRFDEIPSIAPREYGQPFEEIFASADWDFEAIDAAVFAPGAVTVDVDGGPTYALGGTDEQLLAGSFGV
jgi:methenyltetrahydromethanopterin cyclohydrolase